MTDELCINLNIGNPSIPRVWNRFLINNQFRQDVGDEAYQMRKKAEILKYKNSLIVRTNFFGFGPLSGSN